MSLKLLSIDRAEGGELVLAFEHDGAQERLRARWVDASGIQGLEDSGSASLQRFVEAHYPLKVGSLVRIARAFLSGEALQLPIDLS